jgi:hypothetical protein
MRRPTSWGSHRSETSPSAIARRVTSASALVQSPQQFRLQPFSPPDRAKQIHRRPRHVLADVSNGDQVHEVDQGFQTRKLLADQVLDGGGPHGGVLFDDGHRQRVLRAEVKIHRAFGEFGFGEDVVEADVVVGALRELVRRPAQNLLTGGVGTPVGRIGDCGNRASHNFGMWVNASKSAPFPGMIAVTFAAPSSNNVLRHLMRACPRRLWRRI